MALINVTPYILVVLGKLAGHDIRVTAKADALAGTADAVRELRIAAGQEADAGAVGQQFLHWYARRGRGWVCSWRSGHVSLCRHYCCGSRHAFATNSSHMNTTLVLAHTSGVVANSFPCSGRAVSYYHYYYAQSIMSYHCRGHAVHYVT
jgi:hypothetical protein